MFLADMHTHSNCSSDGNVSMSIMAQAAAQLGLNAICITDHCDIEKYDTGEFDSDCFNKELISSSYTNAIKENNNIEILLGMELSGAAHYPEFANSILSSIELDFLIGSVHNLHGMPDFYCLKYESKKQCLSLLESYIKEHFKLIKSSDFDVLGHIGYPLRYMCQNKFVSDLSIFSPLIHDLFKELVTAGKGIELNTSGLRGALKNTIPSIELLKLYRQCAGEIITIGSDAHTVQDIGSNFNDALKILDTAGFRYYCIFRGRHPEFIKL